jgi:HAMP domain-containing protein
MRRHKLWWLLALVVVVTGLFVVWLWLDRPCRITERTFRRLGQGMHRAEVEAILGPPGHYRTWCRDRTDHMEHGMSPQIGKDWILPRPGEAQEVWEDEKIGTIAVLFSDSGTLLGAKYLGPIQRDVGSLRKPR